MRLTVRANHLEIQTESPQDVAYLRLMGVDGLKLEINFGADTETGEYILCKIVSAGDSAQPKPVIKEEKYEAGFNAAGDPIWYGSADNPEQRQSDSTNEDWLCGKPWAR